eukprot:2684928-Rhodomonas_salina.1
MPGAESAFAGDLTKLAASDWEVPARLAAAEGSVLRSRYAMSGPELPYCSVGCYAVSIECSAVCVGCYALSGTELAYAGDMSA